MEIALGSNEKGLRFSSSATLLPWKSPQSIKMGLSPSGVNKKFEPVTDSAPPKKSTLAFIASSIANKNPAGMTGVLIKATRK